jgi:hypothetical protein
MPGPSNASLLARVSDVQRTAGIRLEGIHDKFWGCVVGADLRGEKMPGLVSAHFAYRFQNDIAAPGVQLEGHLPERGLRLLAELWLGFP